MPPWRAYLTRRQPTTSGTTSNSSSRQPSPQTKKRQQVGDYVLIRTIGRGSSGQVKLARHRVTGEYVAIKMIARRHLLSSIVIAQTVERELAILQLIHHPNLITLKQVLQDPTYVYFITEYVDGGELYHVLAGQGRLAEAEARTLFIQLATAVAWCHIHHICHRDLKPENILIDREKKRLKVADFGMATIQPSECLLKTSCGSPHYASPEIVTGKPYYGPPVDVWSCGVILYVLLTGRFPFDDDHVPRLLAKIKAGRHRKLPDYLSPSAKNLIRSMLRVDPNKRATMNDVLCHPWIKAAIGNDNVILRRQCRYDSAVMFHQLKNPVITNPDNLYGTVWETLKVLWRNMPHEKIIAALLSDKPNVQKLTFWLLQKRTERLSCGEEAQERQVVNHSQQQQQLQHNSINDNHSASEETTNQELANHHSLPKIPFPSYRLVPLSLYDKVKICCTSNDDDVDDVLFLFHCLSDSTTMSSSSSSPSSIYSSEKYHHRQQQNLVLRRSTPLSASNHHNGDGLSPNTATTDPTDFTTTLDAQSITTTTDSSSISTPLINIHYCEEFACALCGCGIDSDQQLQQKEIGSITNTAVGNHQYHLSSDKRQKRASSVNSSSTSCCGSSMLFTNYSSSNDAHHFSRLKSSTAEAIVSHVMHVPVQQSTAITSSQLNNMHKLRQHQHGLFTRPFQFIYNLHHELLQSLWSSSYGKPVAASTTTTTTTTDDTTTATINSKNNCTQQTQKNEYFITVNKKFHRWLFHTLIWLDEKIVCSWELTKQQRQGDKYNIYTLDCAADYEGEAAGKLQQLLSQYFEGGLNGHLYPNGQVIWSGSMLATITTLSPSIANFLTKQDRQLDFLCNITMLKNPSNDDNNTVMENSSRKSNNNMYSTLKPLARFRFVLMQGKPYLMRSTVNTLHHLFEIHETQAKLVSKANGWLL